MTSLLLYVSHDLDQADGVLKLWVEAGIPGVTILESAGMQQRGASLGTVRADLSIMPTLAPLLRSTEAHHRTLFSAIDDPLILERAIQATSDYVGDWDLPDVGILLVLPIAQSFGIHKGKLKK